MNHRRVTCSHHVVWNPSLWGGFFASEVALDREEASRRITHSEPACRGCYRDGWNDAARLGELTHPHTFRQRFPDWAVSDEDRLACQRAVANAVERLSQQRRRAA